MSQKNVRQIDRFSISCFVTGFIINPSETNGERKDMACMQTQHALFYYFYLSTPPTESWFAFPERDEIFAKPKKGFKTSKRKYILLTVLWNLNNVKTMKKKL